MCSCYVFTLGACSLSVLNKHSNKTVTVYVHVLCNATQYMLSITATILLYLDCTDIWLDNMMKSLLMRQPLTDSNRNTAQIEELPSTFSEDG